MSCVWVVGILVYFTYLKSISDDKILVSFKFKELADNNSNLSQIIKFVPGSVENTCLLFPI